MDSVCVFCGSNSGANSLYLHAARSVGEALARRGITVVFGGGRVGMMGALADSALAAGGRVVGVIPRSLVAREVGHNGVTELVVVDTMHQRKALMGDLSEGFLALPGGFGTLEELFEVITWSQLGIHAKPCGLLNVAGYFDSLLGFLDHAVAEQFLKPEHRELLIIEEDPEALLDRMESFHPPVLEKWLDRGER
jgi:uncharacterized protein (TIGR00730 family)